MTVEVVTRGLRELVQYFEELPEIAQRASVLAVNDGARFAQREGAKEIRSQVNFKASYLGSATDPDARLAVRKRARGGDVEAVVRGRERPTSLARFVTGSKRTGKRRPGSPVRVKVSAKGGAKEMPGAWLMRLRSGRNLDEENFNLGLAIRLKPGDSINKREFADNFGDFEFGEKRQSPRAGKMYMLYGPSVAQVFRDVAQDLQGPVSDRVADEFVRQFERLR